MTKSIGDYILNFILNEFCKSKVIEWILHVDKTFGPHRYDMIIGHDLMSQLRKILNFDGQAVPWDRLCIDLIGPYETKSNIKGVTIPPLKAVTMFDPATGWFEIKQYDDKRSITVANIVEQGWLTHYLQLYIITLDCSSKFIGQDFHDMCINDYRIKRKVISTQNP
jgi:hypothetical protein